MNETVVKSSAKAVVELNEKIRVLHVDDDSCILKIAKNVLEMEASVQVDTALTVEEALKKLEEEKFDIVVSDYQMPGKDGLDFLKTLRSNGNNIPFIMFTGKGREEVAIKALNLGANMYLNKVGETETVYTELAHSITELARTLRAEEKQCASEEKFRDLFEKANDGLVFVDVYGRIVDINQKAEEITNKKREDIVGRSFLDLGLVSSKDLSLLVEKHRLRGMGEPTERFEFEIEREYGEKRFIEVNSTLIQRNDIPTGSLAIVRDVTERKKAEEALRESEERYSRLSAAAFEGVGIDDQGKIVDANDQLAKMMGCEPSELIGKAVLDFVAPESRGLVTTNVREGYEGPYEHLAVRKDGSVFPVEIRVRTIPYKGHTARVCTIRDITERKKIELELGCFSSAVKASLDGIITGDLNGNIADVNETALRMYGCCDKGELIGKHVQDLLVVRDRPRALQNATETSQTRQGKTAEYTALTKNGTEVPIEVTTQLLADEKGEPTGFVDIVRDLTERKKTEEQTRKTAEEFRRIFETISDLVFIIDRDNKIVRVNKKICEVLKKRPEQLVGKHCYEVVHGTDKPWPECPHKRALDTKGTASGEVDDPHLGIPLSVTVSPIFDEKGEFVQCLHTAKDITERKNSDKIVLENQRKFEGLFAGNPEAAVYLGPDFRIQDINPRFRELFGYSLEEVEGKCLNDVVVPNGKREEAQGLDDQAVKGYARHNTLRKRKDGSLVPVSISAAPVTFDGQLLGYVGMYKDISELKRAEAAMSEMMQKAVMMNEKLRVIGGLTRHDVRNKLSVITGNIYLNRKRLRDSPEMMSSFEEMESACSMIVRLFDFARDYENLGVEELIFIDVDDNIKKAASLFSDLKGVKIANECRGLMVLADSLLRQLFYNLIDNSLKYGGKTSQIRIHCEKSEDQLRLTYEDDGVGISQDAKPKIFIEGYTTGRGTGYGLYLIKKMMEVYGWTIQETGEPGKGARFIITIPKTNQKGKENYRIAEHD